MRTHMQPRLLACLLILAIGCSGDSQKGAAPEKASASPAKTAPTSEQPSATLLTYESPAGSMKPPTMAVAPGVESPQLEAMRTLLKAAVDDNELVNGGTLVWTKGSPRPTWLQLHTTETAIELTLGGKALPDRLDLYARTICFDLTTFDFGVRINDRFTHRVYGTAYCTVADYGGPKPVP